MTRATAGASSANGCGFSLIIGIARYNLELSARPHVIG